MTKIKLIIVDDHKLFREGIKALLAVTDDIEIVGEAEDGAAAMKRIRELEPDVVLMDINMPGLNGICRSMSPARSINTAPGCRTYLGALLELDLLPRSWMALRQWPVPVRRQSCPARSLVLSPISSKQPF